MINFKKISGGVLLNSILEKITYLFFLQEHPSPIFVTLILKASGLRANIFSTVSLRTPPGPLHSAVFWHFLQLHSDPQ